MRGQIHSVFNPTLIEIFDFMTPEECDGFLEEIKRLGIMKPAPTIHDDYKTGEKSEKITDYRTNEFGFVRYSDSPMAREFLIRASQALQIHWSQAENLQIVHYQKGQEYKAHKDAFDLRSKRMDGNTPAEKGNRVATALMYLNDDFEGGGTTFNWFNRTITPEKGKLVVFSDTYIGTQVPDPNSMHAAEPVVTGEKWAVNLWFRNREDTNLNYKEWLKERDIELEK